MKDILEIKPTRKDFLNWAGMGCGCEPYYNYICKQCKSIAQGFVVKHEKEIKNLIKLGFIERNESIGSYKLTRLGWEDI